MNDPLLAQNNSVEGMLTANSFTARSLGIESTLTKLFTGDFAGIDFDRHDVKFNGIFDQYLVAFSGRCGDALPPDKVEMTRQEYTSSTRLKSGASGGVR